MSGVQGLRRSLVPYALIAILILSFSYSGLTVTIDEPAVEEAFPYGDSDGQIQMMPDIPDLEDHSIFLKENGINTKGTGLVYVIVEPTLYTSIQVDIARYINDIESEGYTAEIHTEGWSNPIEVRTLLQSGYGSGMIGAVLIGDIPAPRYEIANDFNEYGYTEFPIDLFYMDLDGEWIDSDFNEIYDDHTAGTGDIEADVWVGRLLPSTLTIPGEDEVSLIKNYLYKNHEYRMGNTSLYDRALVYIDDDWEPWSATHDWEVSLRYENRTLVDDIEETIAPDYFSRITRDYVTYYIEIINETVYGPSIGGETGPIYLANIPVINCTIYVDVDGEWIPIDEGPEYTLDYETGEIDISPISPMDAGWTFYAYYNYTVLEDIDDGSLLFTENETVYGPSIGGETGPLWLDNAPVTDCSIYVEIEGEWIYMEPGVEYYIDYETGEIDVSPICPMDAGWTFYAYYNCSQTLSGYYDWISLFAHSAWYYHGFYYNSGASWSTLYNNELSGAETVAHFYNLFCCSAGEFTESANDGCLSGHYVFSGTHSVCAIASAKTGSMLNFADFYSPLGQGASIGDSFLQWFQLNAESGAGSQFDSRCWFYGMTITGDPTLDTIDDVKPEPPVNFQLNISGDDLELSWTQSPSPDIHHYEVYQALSPDDFDFSSPVEIIDESPLFSSYCCLDENAVAAGNSRYYIVRAVDYSMNDDGNMDIHGMFINNLDIDSWNMISLPFQPSSTDIADVLEDLDIVTVKHYDPVDGWNTYSSFRPDVFNDLDILDNKIGVWLKANTDAMISLGTVPAPTNITLKAGWNLVGYPTLNNSVMVQDAFWGTGADRVEKFDAANPYLISEISPTYIMQPGEAYWVHVSADAVWTIDW